MFWPYLELHLILNATSLSITSFAGALSALQSPWFTNKDNTCSVSVNHVEVVPKMPERISLFSGFIF